MATRTGRMARGRARARLEGIAVPRPIEALIHTDALAHNLARARQAAPDNLMDGMEWLKIQRRIQHLFVASLYT